jgi:hydrogenase nickel incorporation protein HypA/HybF
MHEASIMQNVFEIAFAQLPREAGARIVRLRLRVGALAGVVPEALEFAFDAMKAHTPAASAQLEIERAPARLACGDCGREFDTDAIPAPCPDCDSWHSMVRQGRDLELVLVEMEDSGQVPAR